MKIILTKDIYKIKGNSKILLEVLLGIGKNKNVDDFIISCINLAIEDTRKIYMLMLQDISKEEIVLNFITREGFVDYPTMNENERRVAIAICIYEITQVLKKTKDRHQIQKEILSSIKEEK